MKSSWLNKILGATLLVIIVGCWTYFSNLSFDTQKNTGMLRILGKSNMNRMEICRTLTETELNALPFHMRRPTKCDRYYFPYQLQIILDGLPLATKEISPSAIDKENIMIFSFDFSLNPKNYHMQLTLKPNVHDTWLQSLEPAIKKLVEEKLSGLPTVQKEQEIQIKNNQIELIGLDT